MSFRLRSTWGLAMGGIIMILASAVVRATGVGAPRQELILAVAGWTVLLAGIAWAAHSRDTRSMVAGVLVLALAAVSLNGFQPWQTMLVFAALVGHALTGVFVLFEDHFHDVTRGARPSGRIVVGLGAVGLLLLIGSSALVGYILGLVCFAYGFVALSTGAGFGALWLRRLRTPADPSHA
jgi:hypothetical protein